jgi:hypothetical protein
MKKVVSIRKGTPYKGVYVRALHYVEDSFWKYDTLPDMAIIVAKKGARFYDLVNYGCFGWASFEQVSLPG